MLREGYTVTLTHHGERVYFPYVHGKSITVWNYGIVEFINVLRQALTESFIGDGTAFPEAKTANEVKITREKHVTESLGMQDAI